MSRHYGNRRRYYRRNPDDLERLEKIAEARRLYLEEDVGIMELTKLFRVNHRTMTEWLKGATRPPVSKK
jgi:transposase-like protein